MGTLCLLRKAAGFSRAGGKAAGGAGQPRGAFHGEGAAVFRNWNGRKKQWVEDIDAISDYIAVHDQAWKIVRTNRSLATELGIPPAALVGEPISKPAPYCGNGERAALPFLPRYTGGAGRIHCDERGADVSGFDVADARSDRGRIANDSRVEGYYRPAGG